MSNTLLIFGSLTGNTESVAYKIQELLQEQGQAITVKNAVDADLADLDGTYENLILASSTWDDGLLQADFSDFVERLRPSKVNLKGKKIAIFGCGDRNYIHFCGATGIIEQFFVTELGGEKIIETLNLDGSPESEFNQAAIKTWATNLASLIN